jgi:hypothetical protein
MLRLPLGFLMAVLATPSIADEIVLDNLDIALLRAAAINWDPTESGAPTIDPACPFGSREPLADIRRIAASLDRAIERDDIAGRIPKLESALQIALQAGHLAPGDYTAKDRLYGCHSPLDGMSRFDWKNGRSGSYTKSSPRTPTVSLTLTAEHVALLRNSAVRVTDWQEELDDDRVVATPGIDPKRPYGLMTNVVLDIARILAMPAPASGDAFPENVQIRLGALHEDMRAALIIWLAHATLDPGTYRVGTGGTWMRTEPAVSDAR